MTAPLRIGDPVQIDETTEVLTLVCIDGDAAWCRDGAGGHVQHKLVDLVRAHSRAWPEVELAARSRNNPGFTDANGRRVTIGDRVEYQYAPGRKAKVVDILQDGDGAIQYIDNGVIAEVKWVRLAKLPEELR